MKAIGRALISLSNKEGLRGLVEGLIEQGIEILSTGGTAKAIKKMNLPVVEIEEVTHSPEILGGRVKTLHPKIHGAILADLDNREHLEEMERQGIAPIGLLVVNLYPFAQKIEEQGITLEDAIESIDIGGPTMIRAGAKNWKHVSVVTDPLDYNLLLEELKKEGAVSEEMRIHLAQKAFAHTAAYDSLISRYFWEEGLGKKEELPPVLNLSYSIAQELRYGENPHQKAALYKLQGAKGLSLLQAKQIHGKELSYNNLNDTAAALDLVMEFQEPAAVVVKHANPCGGALGKNITEAFIKAYGGDPLSAFGGIVALNRKVDRDCAIELISPEKFLEVIIAPEFCMDALIMIKERWKGVRLLSLQDMETVSNSAEIELRSLSGGGLLVQSTDVDLEPIGSWKVVSKREPTNDEREDLYLAWVMAKHVKSNAIVVVKDRALKGVGAGQMSRVDAMRIALEKIKYTGGVVGSDAFFPKLDAIEEAGKAGITAIIQPGGSVADEEVINVVNRQGMSMVFTGKRHFKH